MARPLRVASTLGFRYLPCMNISRRHWLAGVITPIASAQPSSWKHQQLETSIVKAVLRHTVKAVNAMAESPPWDRHPFAATHATAESLAFLHFEKTGFHTMLEQHLAQFVPHLQVQPTELAEVVRNWGMHVPEDHFPEADARANWHVKDRSQWVVWPTTAAAARFSGRNDNAHSTGKDDPDATWEPPWPRSIIRSRCC